MRCFVTVLTLLMIATVTYSATSLAVAETKKPTIAVVHKGSYIKYWQLMHDGAKLAAEDFGAELLWDGSAYSDNTAAQIKLVNHYVDLGVEALALIPTDCEKLVVPVKKALSQGVKVVILDSKLCGETTLTFIGTKNTEGGRVAARTLSSSMKAGRKVVLLRHLKGSASTEARAKGFTEEISHNKDIEIVADLYGGGLEGSAYRAVKNLLATGRQFDGIFSVNESTTLGALKALKEAKLTRKIKFVGFDSNDLLLDAVSEGAIDALVTQQPQRMGYLGIKTAMSLLRNSTQQTAIYTTLQVIEKSNVETNRKLLAGTELRQEVKTW